MIQLRYGGLRSKALEKVGTVQYILLGRFYMRKMIKTEFTYFQGENLKI